MLLQSFSLEKGQPPLNFEGSLATRWVYKVLARVIEHFGKPFPQLMKLPIKAGQRLAGDHSAVNSGLSGGDRGVQRGVTGWGQGRVGEDRGDKEW